MDDEGQFDGRGISFIYKPSTTVPIQNEPSKAYSLTTPAEPLRPDTFSDFVSELETEISLGNSKYNTDSTMGVLNSIDPKFPLANIIKYAVRIARGDYRAKKDIVKIAAYAYLYWKNDRKGSL